jgi:hypothetical protein
MSHGARISEETGNNLKKLLLRKRGEVGFDQACNFTVALK